MAKQGVELEKMTVKKGDTVSSTVSLHPKTGTIAVATVFAPEITLHGFLSVSADGEHFYPFYHKGLLVTIFGNAATDVPLPACRAMRIELIEPQDKDKEFRLLALLEVD
jgi:hypothetical protein